MKSLNLSRTLIAAAITAAVTLSMPAHAGVLDDLLGLKSTLNSVIGTVDTATDNRIRQVSIAIDKAIAGLDTTVANGLKGADTLRDKSAGDVFDAMAQANDLIQSNTSNLFDEANASLSSLNYTVRGIPFSRSIPSSVTSVQPYSIGRGPDNVAKDVEMRVAGYFPDVSAAHPAFVEINNHKIKLETAVNNTLIFTLPADAVPAEEQFAHMKLMVPQSKWFGLTTEMLTFNAKVYVRRDKPFSVQYTVNKENPAIWTLVTPTRSYDAHANSEVPTNAQTITAASMFSTLVGDNVNYDMATAKFFSWFTADQSAITQGVNPCESGCVASSGSWGWTQNDVTYSLSAPSCGNHKITRSGLLEFSYFCAGGTHADFNNKPIFKVRNRLPVSTEVAVNQGGMNLASAAIAPAIPVPADWTSVDIVTIYRDGAKRYEQRARLTAGAAGVVGTPTYNGGTRWTAEMAGQALNVATK